MQLLSLFFLPLALPVLATPSPRRPKPNVTFLFSANLTLGVPFDVGNTPFGDNLMVPITDGAFAGPKLKGQ